MILKLKLLIFCACKNIKNLTTFCLDQSALFCCYLVSYRCMTLSGSTRYLVAAVVASLGGVLFGYDLGKCIPGWHLVAKFCIQMSIRGGIMRICSKILTTGPMEY